MADTGNYYPMRDAKIEALDQGQVESVWVVEQLGRPIIKAYNNLLSQTLVEGGTAPGTAGRIAISVAGDDDRAKKLVAGLINDTGFDTVDAGSLAESWRQQPGTPAYCTEMTAPELTQALAAAAPRYATRLCPSLCSAKPRPRARIFWPSTAPWGWVPLSRANN